jgi:hypothetical protein
MNTIKKQLTIAEYAQSIGAKACSLITNGPKNNWLSFVGADDLQIATLPTGSKSQNANTVMQFNVLVFEDDSKVATANSYITTDTVSFA